MKKSMFTAAAAAVTLALSACSPSADTANNSSFTDLSANEGDLPADGNFGPVDELGNGDDALAGNTLDTATGNATLGNGLGNGLGNDSATNAF